MAREVESKFRVGSPEEIREKLIGVGARFLSRNLEKDTYYSLPEGQALSAVRLRSFGQKGLFTIKSAPEAGFESAPGIKVLEELQVEVDDAVLFGRMLEMMGFSPQFKKEKIRESYDWNGLLICLDELPHLGFFLEIEAPEDALAKTAAALGLDMGRAIGMTYMQIFSRYKAARNAPDLELTFESKR